MSGPGRDDDGTEGGGVEDDDASMRGLSPRRQMVTDAMAAPVILPLPPPIDAVSPTTSVLRRRIPGPSLHERDDGTSGEGLRGVVEEDDDAASMRGLSPRRQTMTGAAAAPVLLVSPPPPPIDAVSPTSGLRRRVPGSSSRPTSPLGEDDDRYRSMSPNSWLAGGAQETRPVEEATSRVGSMFFKKDQKEKADENGNFEHTGATDNSGAFSPTADTTDDDSSHSTGFDFNWQSAVVLESTRAASDDFSEDGTGHDSNLPQGVTARDQQEDAMMRILAGQLSRDWRRSTLESSALERRLRDFQFAQNKRRDKYGEDRPWGILGLYEHLASIRIDLEWAEDAAWRREHSEPYLSWSDFEATRKEGFNKPFFTYILLAVCTVMLIVSIAVNDWKIEPLSVNPMIGPSAETLLILGAKSTPLIVDDGEWYRLFTPMFLHAGLVHYFLNMLALWFVGSAVEQCHGFIAAAIIFIIPAVGGTILSALFLPEYVSVGASGGIFGLVGACIADIVMNWQLLFSKQINAEDKGKTVKHVKVLCWLILDIVVNCLLGLTPLVDNFTHLGGMIYGFLCGLSTMERLSTGFFGFHQNFCGHVKELFVRFFGIFVCVALIMTTTVALVESDGRTSPCNSCRYLSCLPMPPWKGDLDKWWYCDDCGMLVTADARRDEATQMFKELSLTCPDGEIETINILSDEISDKATLANDLPDYCRRHCENIFT